MLELLFQTPTSTATTFVVAALLALAFRSLSRTGSSKLPPGPPADPIIGHLRSLQDEWAHLANTELNKQYGDVASIRVFSTPIVILGTWKIANDLFSKRGTIYSGRPRTPFPEEVLGIWRVPGLKPNNSIWKEQRRVLHAHMVKDEARVQYRPDIERNAHDFVLQEIEAADKAVSSDYDPAIHKTILNIMYGIKIKSEDDPILQTSLKVGELFSITVLPGKFVVNLFPSLLWVPSWFPGAGWKRKGKIWRKYFDDSVQIPWAMVKKDEAEGHAKQSVALSMMREKTTLDEDHAATLAGTTLMAGAETTASYVQFFIYAMLSHPKIQKKAQEEVDRVVGRDRLPMIEDLQDLPYIEALAKELHRWRPISPISLPHQLTQDDVYEDFHLPKGSIVIQNTWKMSRDEKMYPNPDEFIPERFMVNDPPMDPKLYAFGIGRRICPGMGFAENVYMSMILTILATVDVVKARDARGNEITPDGSTTGRLTNSPTPFPFKFKPRSDASVALLRAAVGA